MAHLRDDPTEELVCRIYEAGVDAEQLDVVASEICRHVGADILFSHVRHESGEPDASLLRHGIPDEVLKDYAAYYWRINPITPVMLRAPLDVLLDLYSVIDPNELARSEVINDWALPMGLVKARGWRGLVTPERVLAVTVGRSSKRAFSEDELRLITRLAPYLSNAARLRYALADANEEISSLHTLIDSLRCATFLVDERRFVVAANKLGTAMLRDGTLLRYGQRRLTAVDPTVDGQLRNAIRRGVLGAVGPPVSLGSQLPHTPVAFVLPRSGRHDDPERGAVVLVPPPDPDGTAIETWLRVGHGLTRAEANVALRASRGEELREIAASRHVALETVRGQVKRAMQKVGVRRRAQLTRLVAQAASPFGLSAAPGSETPR